MTTINKAMNLGFEDHSVTLVAAGRRILINEWTLTGRTVTADQCRAIARLFDKAAGMAEEPIREDDDESKATCDDCGRDFREVVEFETVAGLMAWVATVKMPGRYRGIVIHAAGASGYSLPEIEIYDDYRE